MKDKDKNLKKIRENGDFTFRRKTLRLTGNFSTGKKAARHQDDDMLRVIEELILLAMME